MADTYNRGTRAAMRALAIIVCRLHDLPQRGRQIGPGIHVPMPLVFTLQQKNIGWSVLPYRLSRRLHPTNDDWGCMLNDETKALFANVDIRQDRLTVGQRAAFTTALGNTLALDATWNTAPDDGDDPLETNGG